MAKTTRKKKTPMRMCVACKEMKPKKELMRIVKTPEGSILIDDVGKKPGRGAYLCLDTKCIEEAVVQKRLEKALRCAVPKELFDALCAKAVDLP